MVRWLSWTSFDNSRRASSCLLQLMTVMQVFNRLFESDEQTDNDSGDVDEEVPPRVDGRLGRPHRYLRNVSD
jgi:hypothetical protein